MNLLRSLLVIFNVAVFVGHGFAATVPEKTVAQYEVQIKSLLSSFPKGGVELTARLIQEIKTSPMVVSSLIAAIPNVNLEQRDAIWAALAQAIAELTETDPQAAATLRQLIANSGSDVLKQQIAQSLSDNELNTGSIDATQTLRPGQLPLPTGVSLLPPDSSTYVSPN